MKKKEVKYYKDPKLNEFRKRLRPIHLRNLKKLAKSYRDEISRLSEYSLVIAEELHQRGNKGGKNVFSSIGTD